MEMTSKACMLRFDVVGNGEVGNELVVNIPM